MMSERDAMKRNSDFLQESHASEDRLNAALMTIEDLTVKLSTQQHDYQNEVKKILIVQAPNCN
jgi:hypothetical protein